MSVLLDPRDGSGDLLGYFPAGFAETSMLNSADVMGGGNGPYGPIVWGVEIKKLSDCIDSMQSGRLVEQLGKMQEDYDWRFLLVEGAFRQCPKTGRLQKSMVRGKYEFWADVYFGNRQKLTYDHFMSWLLGLTLLSGSYMLTTSGRQETTDQVVCIARFFDKPWEEHGSSKVFHVQQPPGFLIPTTTMLVIKDLASGVGWEKAAAAAKFFKTARAAVNATEKEWKEVPGIDKVLAGRLVEGASKEHVVKRRTRKKS